MMGGGQAGPPSSPTLSPRPAFASLRFRSRREDDGWLPTLFELAVWLLLACGVVVVGGLLVGVATGAMDPDEVVSAVTGVQTEEFLALRASLAAMEHQRETAAASAVACEAKLSALRQELKTANASRQACFAAAASAAPAECTDASPFLSWLTSALLVVVGFMIGAWAAPRPVKAVPVVMVTPPSSPHLDAPQSPGATSQPSFRSPRSQLSNSINASGSTLAASGKCGGEDGAMQTVPSFKSLASSFMGTSFLQRPVDADAPEVNVEVEAVQAATPPSPGTPMSPIGRAMGRLLSSFAGTIRGSSETKPQHGGVDGTPPLLPPSEVPLRSPHLRSSLRGRPSEASPPLSPSLKVRLAGFELAGTEVQMSPHRDRHHGRGGMGAPTGGPPPRFAPGDPVEAWVAGEWRVCLLVALGEHDEAAEGAPSEGGPDDVLVELGPLAADVAAAPAPVDELFPRAGAGPGQGVQVWVPESLLRRMLLPPSPDAPCLLEVPPTPMGRREAAAKGSPSPRPASPEGDCDASALDPPPEPPLPKGPAAPYGEGCPVEVYVHGEAMWVPGEVAVYHDSTEEYVVKLAASRLPETVSVGDVRAVLPRAESVRRAMDSLRPPEPHSIPRLPLHRVPTYDTTWEAAGALSNTPRAAAAALRFGIGETAEVLLGDEGCEGDEDPGSQPWQVCRVVKLPAPPPPQLLTARSPRAYGPPTPARTPRSVRYQPVEGEAEEDGEGGCGPDAIDGVRVLTIGGLTRVTLRGHEIGVWLPDQGRAAVVPEARLRKLRLAVKEVERKVVVEKVAPAPPVQCDDCGVLRRNLEHAIASLTEARLAHSCELARVRDQLHALQQSHDDRRADYARAEGLLSLESCTLEADVRCERALREDAEARRDDAEAQLQAAAANTAAASARFLNMLHPELQ